MSDRRPPDRELCPLSHDDVASVPEGRSGAGIAPAVVGTATLALCGAVVAGLTSGADGAWGVVVGAVTTVAVFSLGMSITHVVATLSPALSLLVALLTYALQLVLLVLVLVGLERSTLLDEVLDRRWIGGTVIVGTLVWSAALVRSDVRRTRLYHNGTGQGEPSEEASSGLRPGAAPPG